MKTCPKYTFGVGDRFAHGAHAQLQAFIAAKELGIDITPVWNKSNREHEIIGSEPQTTRDAADAAVKDLGWTGEYLLDADHINLSTVDRFIAPCDFFTLDVADDIGEAADPADVKAFIDRHPELIGTVTIEGIDQPFEISREDVEKTANQFLKATQKARAIYDHIVAAKGEDFVTEASMDETVRNIASLKGRYADIGLQDSSRVFNTELIAAMELGAMLDVAEAMAVSAAGRNESRGAHTRKDMTTRDDVNCLHHSLCHFDPAGPRLGKKDVTLGKWEPVERKY